MASPYTQFSTRQTPQREPIATQIDRQVKNSAGGYVYDVGDFKALERFLILGTEGGTYYVKEKALTREAAIRSIKAIAADGRRAVEQIVAVSDSGRAPKNDPAIFALALAASAEDPKTRAFALSQLPKVCRIPTHLFHFITYVKQFRGFGSGLKKAVARWYNDQPVDKLAYEVVKYQQRDGVSNADCLRLGHPKTADIQRNLLYKYIVDGWEATFDFCRKAEPNVDGGYPRLPDIVRGFEDAKGWSIISVGALVQCIRDYNLSREMVPTEALKHREVWEALLEKMPYTAMIRNLGNMSKAGLLTPLSDASKTVAERLHDQAALKKARIHPLGVLIAMKQYALGHGLKGDGWWNPDPLVVDALDDAFYLAFDQMEPTGKRLLIAVDMSGSMWGSDFPSWRGRYDTDIAGTCVHPCEAAAAMALAAAKKESNYYIMGFSSEFKQLGITPKMRLTDAVQHTLAKTFGRTDCALPMIWARENKVNVDAFIVLTDNETWAGSMHPSQALKRYREFSGINAKEIVVGMTSTGFTIADPKDPGTLDIVGFDAAAPQVIGDFIRQ